jgi:uncharacterized protein (DUF433 family)
MRIGLPWVSLAKGAIEMNWQDRIHFDPGVLGGKPVVKGTRLAVEKIV